MAKEVIQITALAFGSAYIATHPKFGLPPYRTFRVGMYALIFPLIVTFVYNSIWLHGYETTEIRMALPYLGWMMVSILIGGICYLTRVSLHPESM